MPPLLSFDFWLSITPPPLLMLYERGLAGLAIAALIAAVVLARIAKKKRGAARATIARVRRLLTTYGIVSFLLLFFSFERAVILSMRLWWLLLGIGIVAWLFFIIRAHKRAAPKQKVASDAQRVFEKYLPR